MMSNSKTRGTFMDQQPVFQVMPPLAEDEFAALEADIAERGIVVPVVVDQHGRLLDGHHRSAIAARLGIECPTEVREVADDEEARATALALNLTRRHLTREQRRELIAQEIGARPDDSDRAIARRFGCSPSTVGAVRRMVSNLDTDESTTDPMTRAEALDSIARIQQNLGQFNGHMHDVVEKHGLIGAVMSLDMLREMAEKERDRGDPLHAAEMFLQPWIDVLSEALAGVGVGSEAVAAILTELRAAAKR